MNLPARRATQDYSTGPVLSRMPPAASRAAFAGVAIVGAILLVVAEFSPVLEVVVGSLDTVRRSVDGGDNHGWAQLVIALAALPLTWAASGGARAPAVGLVALGAAALVVALAIDLPDTTRRGSLPESISFQDARADPGSGLYLEITGGALLVAAGTLLWMLGAAQRRQAKHLR